MHANECQHAGTYAVSKVCKSRKYDINRSPMHFVCTCMGSGKFVFGGMKEQPCRFAHAHIRFLFFTSTMH